VTAQTVQLLKVTFHTNQ